MSYDVTTRKKHNYLHATITGENSEANVRRYFEQLAREAAQAKCRRLLIEERLEGPRLDSQSVFRIAAEGSPKFRGVFRKIAFVDVYAEDHSMKNAEAVASNRGLPVRIFNTVAEADEWLQAPG